MSTPTAVQSTETASIAERAVVAEAARDSAEAAVSLRELSVAEILANDLLAQASRALDLASLHYAEAPEDVHAAQAAVLEAKQTLQAIQNAQRTGDRGAHGRATDRIANLATTVQAATSAVSEHEAGTSASTSKKAAIASAATQAAAANKSIAARVRSFVMGDNDDEIVIVARRRAAAAEQERINNDDEHYVGERGHRRQRKATSRGGRAATSVLGAVIGEAEADEVVSTAGTAAQRTAEGAAAVASGDVRAIDRTGLTFGRGVKNALNDTGLVSADTAQTIGHAATVTAQTAGRGIATVRNTAVGAAVAVRDSADDLRDAAADRYQRMWQYGRELDQLKGIYQNNARTRALFDTDRDGRVELHEIVNKLKQFGIHDMKNVDYNGDGNITAQEVATAIRTRGQNPNR